MEIIDPKDLLQVLSASQKVLVLAINLEGTAVDMEDLRYWLTSLRIVATDKGEPRIAYQKFCAAMSLEDGAATRELFRRLEAIPFTEVRGFHTQNPRPLRMDVFIDAGIHTLADLCGHRLSEFAGTKGFGPLTLQYLRDFAKKHGVTLPE